MVQPELELEQLELELLEQLKLEQLELELKLELELVGDCSGSGREEVGSEYPGGGRELLRREV